MKEIYRKLQWQAIRIADQYPTPDFYQDFAAEVDRSFIFFRSDPTVGRLHDQVAGIIENDYGHGLEHVRAVALDAGALALIEGCRDNCTEQIMNLRLLMAHSAGLLHDIRRKQKNHAAAGAEAALEMLGDYGFSDEQISDICLAIKNHEAFGFHEASVTTEGALLSDCLYDADKFRWGPENFTRTIWGMISGMDISIENFMLHFPRGMSFLEKIRTTFRTPTGRRYGPQFIDIGLAIGNDLYEWIRSEHDSAG